MLALHLGGVARDLVAQLQRRIAGPLRVVLVSDRRAEERHDAVAGVLVHRAFEAVHTLGQDLEEALQDAVPLFGIELRGELHRALHVGEHHRHLLALSLERRLALQDLLREMPRRIVGGRSLGAPHALRRAGRGPALQTEPGRRRQLRTAASAGQGKGRPAIQTELGAIWILVSAAGAVHAVHPVAGCAP